MAFTFNNVCASAHEILKVCDKVRDDILPNLGVRLEDHDGMYVSKCNDLKFVCVRCKHWQVAEGYTI